MAWSCRSHSPPWSQIGQSSGWLISRNSITPSRAFLTIGVLVKSCLGAPSLLGARSFTPMAQDACGLGMPCTSIRHMRQLPAIDSRSWKQKRGISAPAASHAWSSVYSRGTSISLPSTMSLVMLSVFSSCDPASSLLGMLMLAAPVVAFGGRPRPDSAVRGRARSTIERRAPRGAGIVRGSSVRGSAHRPVAFRRRPPEPAMVAPQVLVFERHGFGSTGCPFPIPPLRAPRRGRRHCACIRRCAARSRDGNAAAGPAPARRRRRRRRKWCGPRSGS